MAQQTAMQEAIEYLKLFNLEASVIILEDRFLEKEKKQMIHFAETMPTKKGITQEGEPYVQYDAEQHYKNTYENNK